MSSTCAGARTNCTPAIQEVIQILELTKRNFHSKELALLRSRLEQLSRTLHQKPAGD